MSEFESRNAPSTDFQLDTLVADVESKFIAAEDALSDLRHAVRQLKAYRPSAQSAPPLSAQAPEAASPALDWGLGAKPEPVDPPAPGPPGLNEETVGKSSWTAPRRAEAEPELKPRVEDYGMDSTSEGSWPIARPRAEQAPAVPEAPEPEPVARAKPEPVEEPVAQVSEDDEEARREEVARVVAQMRDGDDESEGETSEPEEDDESKRRDVARMVADLRESAVENAETAEDEAPAAEEDDGERRRDVARMVAEMREGAAEAIEASDDEAVTAQEDDDEARRQDVARMVAEMGNGAVEASEDDSPAAADDAGSRREDVASMVAQMRAEMAGGVAADDEPSPGSDDADAEVRDEVRRAVEAARAEMASGYKDDAGAAAEGGAGDSRFSFTDWQSTHVEPSGPPVIVIKDSEGRVELARVYETLNRVNCDENAALLNYTPHSVTVGLNAKASVPEVDALTEAVKATFGRVCVVDSDGVRVNVQIGKDLKGKDSAA